MAEKIGEYNRQVVFQRKSTDLDATNMPIGWVEHKRKWCKIASQTGLGSIRDGAATETGITGTQTLYSFRLVSYDESITQDMRILFRGEVGEIKRVLHDHAGRQFTDVVAAFEAGRG